MCVFILINISICTCTNVNSNSPCLLVYRQMRRYVHARCRHTSTPSGDLCVTLLPSSARDSFRATMVKSFWSGR